MEVRQIQRALARHFDYTKYTCVPNIYLGGGEMDFAAVSEAGYLVEVEIKLTVSDWREDLKKAKWGADYAKFRLIVSRFYYAVPTELLPKAPTWVPKSAGLIACWLDGKRVRMKVHREADRAAAHKVGERELGAINASLYHRFWQRELRAA